MSLIHICRPIIFNDVQHTVIKSILERNCLCLALQYIQVDIILIAKIFFLSLLLVSLFYLNMDSNIPLL
jgi:hypothetical protein